MAESAVVKQKYPKHQTACVPGIFKDVATPLNDFLPLFLHRKRGEENSTRDTMLMHGMLRLWDGTSHVPFCLFFLTEKEEKKTASVLLCKRIVGCDYGVKRPTLVFPHGKRGEENRIRDTM